MCGHEHEVYRLLSHQVAEWTAIREELYFLRPLRAKIAGLLFWLVMLLWYQVSFWVLHTTSSMPLCCKSLLIGDDKTKYVCSSVCLD